MSNIKIGKNLIRNFNKPYIIAEACINHQGNFKLAEEMVYISKAANTCFK